MQSAGWVKQGSMGGLKHQGEVMGDRKRGWVNGELKIEVEQRKEVLPEIPSPNLNSPEATPEAAKRSPSILHLPRVPSSAESSPRAGDMREINIMASPPGSPGIPSPTSTRSRSPSPPLSKSGSERSFKRAIFWPVMSSSERSVGQVGDEEKKKNKKGGIRRHISAALKSAASSFNGRTSSSANEGMEQRLREHESAKAQLQLQAAQAGSAPNLMKKGHSPLCKDSMPTQSSDSMDEPTAWRVNKLFTLIPGKLSFTVHMSERATLTAIRDFPDLFFFSCDCQEQYTPFLNDFGPVNLGVVHSFLMYMKHKTGDPRLKERHMVYYTDINVAHRTNAAFLLGAYLMIEHGMSPEEAAQPFLRIKPNAFMPFRDASSAPSTYDLDLRDCLKGLQRAVDLGWYNFKSFDLRLYDALDNPISGDMHVLCPKFVAFRGPVGGNKGLSVRDMGACRPKQYFEPFKKLGVSAVVRLNEATTYSASEFTENSFNHYDLFFEDCSIPPPSIVERFLDICDQEGRVAVHCFAGLGRTGTLIAVWMMKHYGLTASEAIGWLRIVRPGSVIGPQQQYLEMVQRARWEGNKPIFTQEVDITDLAYDREQMATDFLEAVNERAKVQHVAPHAEEAGKQPQYRIKRSHSDPHVHVDQEVLQRKHEVNVDMSEHGYRDIDRSEHGLDRSEHGLDRSEHGLDYSEHGLDLSMHGLNLCQNVLSLPGQTIDPFTLEPGSGPGFQRCTSGPDPTLST